jgi:hypothetical protein
MTFLPDPKWSTKPEWLTRVLLVQTVVRGRAHRSTVVRAVSNSQVGLD